MLGYVTFGTNDKEKSLAFYDALFKEMGGERMFDNGRMIFWAIGGRPVLGVGDPFDGSRPASAGNGTMVALRTGSREDVDRLYAKALSLGATDEGAPGERGATFYGGYFRDFDGNKIVFFHVGQQ